MLQVLKHWDCSVYVFTRSQAHREHALELGAAWAGDSGDRAGRLLDKAVIFAPAGELVIRALENIRPGGIVSINAIHMSDIPAFPYNLLWGERAVRSVANATCADGVEFLKLAEKIGLRATVKPYLLEDASQALDDMKHSRFNGEAVLKVN